MNLNNFNCYLMSNVWATMPYAQLSLKMFVNCIDNRQNQLFSEMSLRDVMELPSYTLKLLRCCLACAVLCVYPYVRVTEVVETKDQGNLFRQMAMMAMNIFRSPEPGGWGCICTIHISFHLQIPRTHCTRARFL